MVLQRNSKFVILGNLGMPGHTLKMMIAIWKNLWRLYIVGKRLSSLSSRLSSLRYYKDIVNFLFWVIWTCLAKQTQKDTINLKKTFVFIFRQKINFTPMLVWRYGTDMQTCYFHYFRHAWLQTPKMIVLTCRRLWFLSACQK